jgi:hypothetical protein
MDVLREQFVIIELECMYKQRQLILDTMKKNEEQQNELQIYLDKLNYNINNLQKGVILD